MNVQNSLTELQEELWKAVLAKVEEIQREEGRHGNREVAWLHPRGEAVSTILDIQQLDGSHRVFRVGAYRTPGFLPETQVRVDRYFHNAEPFWDEQLSDRSNAVVIDGRHYRIRGRESTDPSRKGFAGRRYTIRYYDGREVTTTDLWFQGVIPPAFRDRLPDDAEFVTEGAS